jgi:hypothetical protein
MTFEFIADRESSFKDKYFAIDGDKYGFPLTDEDFEYSWRWPESMLPFWKLTAESNLHVIFSVDQ